MIYFDEFTRLFSVVDDRTFAAKGLSYHNSMALGAMGGIGINAFKRSRYKDSLIAKGWDPNKAEFEAKRRYGGVVGSAIGGAGAGAALRFGAGRLKSAGKELGIK